MPPFGPGITPRLPQALAALTMRVAEEDGTLSPCWEALDGNSIRGLPIDVLGADIAAGSSSVSPEAPSDPRLSWTTISGRPDVPASLSQTGPTFFGQRDATRSAHPVE